MNICQSDFEQLLTSLMRQKNLEQNLSTVLRNMEKEFQYQSLGIFLKLPKSNIFRLKISRNISHTYEKMTTFPEDHPLIKELHRFTHLKLSDDKRYKFEKQYNQLIIFPLYNNQELLGFLFMDSKQQQFTPEDEVKCGIYSSLISIIVSMNNLRHEVDQLEELDNLTQFLNFGAFVERSELIFSQSNRYERELTLILVKLNNYNNIIRTIGKDNAQDLVKQISDILRYELRTSDLIGIVNRDTFALLLPETAVNSSVIVVERLNKIIKDLPLMMGYKVNWGLVGNSEATKKFKKMINLAQDALFEASRQREINYIIA